MKCPVLVSLISLILTHLQEPSFPVRVEERQREVVPVVLGELQRLVTDADVEFLGVKGQRSPGGAGRRRACVEDAPSASPGGGLLRG